jgi:hypothetical protein
LVNRTLLAYSASMHTFTPLNSSTQLSVPGLAAVADSRRLLLVETPGRESESLTELIAALALRGPFHVIAGGEWLPGYALARSLRAKTLRVKQALDHVILTRPFTCYQVLDLVSATRPGTEPLLVLDFLHHFYNDDVDLPIRLRVFEQSCRHLQQLALFRPVLVFTQREQMPLILYQHFFSLLASIADEIFQLEEISSEPAQLALFPICHSERSEESPLITGDSSVA